MISLKNGCKISGSSIMMGGYTDQQYFGIDEKGQINDYNEEGGLFVYPPPIIQNKSVGSLAPNLFTEMHINGVVIPANVTIVGSEAFSICSDLQWVRFLGSEVTINDNAFAYCSNLKTIILPRGLTVLSSNLMRGCGSLASLVIPSTVTEIKTGAFAQCNNLSNITIGSNVLINSNEYNFKNQYASQYYSAGTYIKIDVDRWERI